MHMTRVPRYGRHMDGKGERHIPRPQVRLISQVLAGTSLGLPISGGHIAAQVWWMKESSLWEQSTEWENKKGSGRVHLWLVILQDMWVR
jgi:hypothetical protein